MQCISVHHEAMYSGVRVNCNIPTAWLALQTPPHSSWVVQAKTAQKWAFPLVCLRLCGNELPCLTLQVKPGTTFLKAIWKLESNISTLLSPWPGICPYANLSQQNNEWAQKHILWQLEVFIKVLYLMIKCRGQLPHLIIAILINKLWHVYMMGL